MNNETASPRKNIRYDEAFKQSAGELWLQGGKSAATIAAGLSITTQSVKLWMKQSAGLPVTGMGQHSAQQLEEENGRHLAQQRDIQKNAGHNCHTVRQRFERGKVIRLGQRVTEVHLRLSGTMQLGHKHLLRLHMGSRHSRLH